MAALVRRDESCEIRITDTPPVASSRFEFCWLSQALTRFERGAPRR